MIKESIRKIFILLVTILAIALSGCDPDAALEKTTYTVEFKLDGGVRNGGGELEQTILYGQSAEAPSVSKEGYSFVEWDKSFDKVKENLVVNAVWAINKYTVTFDLDGGSRTDGGALSQTIEHGGSAVAPVVSKTDAIFDCWDRGITNITSNITVKAVWIDLKMITVPVPSGGITFPTGTSDDGTASVDYVYQVGETLVTWRMWKKVYDWATSSDRGTDMYHFQNPGRMGSHDSGEELQYMTELHPVTCVSWRDIIVWCNAVTQWYNAMTSSNLEPVYRYNDSIVRDSRNDNSTACDNAEATANNGFRLPIAEEWELAARWRTDSTNTVEGFNDPWFTKGNSASGATANYEDSSATGEVAWCNFNSSLRTHPVAEKQAKSLEIYGMSGNVWEWLFTASDSNRQLRGGSWASSTLYSQIGNIYTGNPHDVRESRGFRLFRTP
ncbi:MAG: SUMF1/EgtB/PvdO family nonheme iron enzyme [Spirochaetales bacterium]|nr:SUMF1/EgtB/PvdO family nonheme iron enzyme [Spirochaetales bacterium]